MSAQEREIAEVDLLASSWEMMSVSSAQLMALATRVRETLNDMTNRHPLYRVLSDEYALIIRLVALRALEAPASQFETETYPYHDMWDAFIYRTRISLLTRIHDGEPSSMSSEEAIRERTQAVSSMIQRAGGLIPSVRENNPHPAFRHPAQTTTTTSPPRGEHPVTYRAPWHLEETSSDSSDDDVPAMTPRVHRPSSAPPTYRESRTDPILENEHGITSEHPSVEIQDHPPEYSEIRFTVTNLHLHPDGTMHIGDLSVEMPTDVLPGSAVQQLVSTLEHLFSLRRTRLPSVPELPESN